MKMSLGMRRLVGLIGVSLGAMMLIPFFHHYGYRASLALFIMMVTVFPVYVHRLLKDPPASRAQLYLAMVVYWVTMMSVFWLYILPAHFPTR